MDENYYVDENGYLKFSDSHKWVHRWMAEKEVLRRKLRDGEIVHHLDHDKRNNRPENLCVCQDQEEHESIHEEEARKYGEKYRYTPIPHYMYVKSKQKEQEGIGCMLSFLIMIGIISFSILIIVKLII